MERIALCNNHYNRHSLSFFLESVSKLSVSELELCPYASYGDIRLAEDAERLSEALKAAGLHAGCIQVEQGGVVPFNLGSDQAETEYWTMDAAEKMLSNMHFFGAEQLIVSAGRQAVDLPKEAGWERSRKNLITLGKLAAKQGITILLCSDGSDTFSNLVCSSRELLTMLREVDLPNVQAYVDTVSTAAAGEAFGEAMALLTGRIGRVAIADGPDGFLLPGDGCIDMDKCLKELRASSYKGPVTLRLQHWRYDFEPHRYTEELLSRAGRHLKEHL